MSSLHQVLLHSAFLAHQSFVMADAIGRTVVRLYARRHLLEWETAADAAERLQGEWPLVLRRMWVAPVAALALAVAVIALRPSNALWALPVVTLWAISPYFAYGTGLPKQRDRHVLDVRERRELRQTARLTWRFFEEMVSQGDNWLVPDNYQENRPDPIAHRTSPTNIGLQMLAAVSAWDLGYLSAGECLTHLDHIVDTLQKLPRYRGHLFNWYDTRSLVPLAPLYVSTVDSGNLLGYLMTISGALPSIADAEVSIDRRFQDGLSDTLNLFERDARPVIAALGRESARDFRADLRRIRAALDATPIGIAGDE